MAGVCGLGLPPGPADSGVWGPRLQPGAAQSRPPGQTQGVQGPGLPPGPTESGAAGRTHGVQGQGAATWPHRVQGLGLPPNPAETRIWGCQPGLATQPNGVWDLGSAPWGQSPGSTSGLLAGPAGSGSRLPPACPTTGPGPGSGLPPSPAQQGPGSTNPRLHSWLHSVEGSLGGRQWAWGQLGRHTVVLNLPAQATYATHNDK